MSIEPLSNTPAIHLNAFLRTLIVSLMVWGAAVFVITTAGQPGVVCMTPLTWLLALWSGRQYVRLSNGQPGRLGPALLGVVVGPGLGLICATLSALIARVMAGAMSLRASHDKMGRRSCPFDHSLDPCATSSLRWHWPSVYCYWSITHWRPCKPPADRPQRAAHMS